MAKAEESKRIDKKRFDLEALDQITDKVLAYRPEKVKAVKDKQEQGT